MTLFRFFLAIDMVVEWRLRTFLNVFSMHCEKFYHTMIVLFWLISTNSMKIPSNLCTFFVQSILLRKKSGEHLNKNFKLSFGKRLISVGKRRWLVKMIETNSISQVYHIIVRLNVIFPDWFQLRQMKSIVPCRTMKLVHNESLLSFEKSKIWTSSNLISKRNLPMRMMQWLKTCSIVSKRPFEMPCRKKIFWPTKFVVKNDVVFRHRNHYRSNGWIKGIE